MMPTYLTVASTTSESVLGYFIAPASLAPQQYVVVAPAHQRVQPFNAPTSAAHHRVQPFNAPPSAAHQRVQPFNAPPSAARLYHAWETSLYADTHYWQHSLFWICLNLLKLFVTRWSYGFIWGGRHCLIPMQQPWGSVYARNIGILTPLKDGRIVLPTIASSSRDNEYP